ARDLAADLDRWLAGEPIAARPAGRVERLWRWCRRRPALAGLTAALILVVVGALALETWQWRKSDRLRQPAEEAVAEARPQGERAERHRREADGNYVQARQAVDEFARLLSENPHFDAPGLHVVRKRLLDVVLRYDQDFLRQHGDDPKLRAELAA